MLPGYMQGTPEELRQRAQQGRADQDRGLAERTQAFNANPAAYEQGPLGHNAGYFMKSRQQNPALDALDAFSFQSPASQNQSYADAAQADAPGPMSQWGKYDAVLQARGAQMPQAGQFLGRRGYQQTPYSHAAHDGYGSTDDLIAQSQGGAPALSPGRNQGRASQGAFNALKGYYGR